MKVLFVVSGNHEKGVSQIVLNQSISLQKKDVNIEFFLIKGKGLRGYLANIKPLKRVLIENDFDIIHAHYSLSGFIAALAGAKPLVVSLMGSDVNMNIVGRFIIRFFNYFFWDTCIVKSFPMKRKIRLQDSFVVPNGVDFTLFRPLAKKESIRELGFDLSKKHVLFAADPKRKEKNYSLAAAAFNRIENDSIEYHYLKDVEHKLMVYYYNASDVIVLTSLWEGSPNVIKEAMACNRPVVTTDVGDVKDVIGNTRGCFVTKFDENIIANKIIEALDFEKTEGREKILHLDANIIAEKIRKLYKGMIENANM